MKKLESTTGYFLAEGKRNLSECIRLSFVRAAQAGIRTIVIFTLNGEGVELACNEFLGDPRYENQRVVAVSYPFGTVPAAALQIPEERMRLIQKFGIPLLRAMSPIDDVPLPNSHQSNIVRKTLEIFSGGTALCIWAILGACDAGVIPYGEHVIGCCADTSIVAKATPSAQFLSSFAVREFVCKPLIHDISKGEALAEEINAEGLIEKIPHKRLPEQRRLPQEVEGNHPKC
jgi:hypothetical protein